MDQSLRNLFQALFIICRHFCDMQKTVGTKAIMKYHWLEGQKASAGVVSRSKVWIPLTTVFGVLINIAIPSVRL